MNTKSAAQIDQDAEGVIVAVDLAKSVYQLRVANQQWKGIESHRLTRAQFERWFLNRVVSLVIMEACGSAHHWARWLTSLGIDVMLLPPAYIRAYVRRNKTDAADAAALLEAARNSEIKPVRVKTVEQQALQGLHRTRSLWMGARTQHINTLRGFCREFGLHIPVGAKTGLTQMAGLIGDADSALPQVLRPAMKMMLEEVRQLEAHIEQITAQLKEVARHSAGCQLLMTVPGIGLMTGTGMTAAFADVTHMQSSRHFASWFGITPKESSSGKNRRLGRISKQGDTYLRMLLVHGARSVLRAAVVAQAAGRKLDALHEWALQVLARTNQNKAACAVANKLARICYACLKHQAPYNPRLA